MDRYESEIDDWEAKINADLDMLKTMFKGQAILDELLGFRAAWDTYLRIWREQVVLLSRAQRDDEAFALARKRGAAGTTAQEVMYKLDELHDINFAASSYNLEQAERDFRRSQIILMVTVLFTVMIGLAFGIKQSSLIAGAMNTASEAAQRVAQPEILIKA